LIKSDKNNINDNKKKCFLSSKSA